MTTFPQKILSQNEVMLKEKQSCHHVYRALVRKAVKSKFFATKIVKCKFLFRKATYVLFLNDY